MSAIQISSNDYDSLHAATAELNKAWKNSLEHGEMTRLEAFKRPPIIPRGRPSDPGFDERLQAFMNDQEERKAMVFQMMKNTVVARHPEPPTLYKAGGVTSALGYNFYDLRAPVRLLFPVHTPFRNTLPRIGKTNEGYGSAAHWKATRSVGSVPAMVSEGNRNAISTPDENDYYATYVELGMERLVTLTAQFAGEGYADNLADEHLRGLFSLQLQEEGYLLNGNSGASGANTGYKLTTAPTLSTGVVATTHTVGAAGNCASSTSAVQAGADLPYTAALTTANYVSAAVVCLTAMGNPANQQYGYGLNPIGAGALTPNYQRTNADGSRDTINGGMSAISAINTPVQATSGNLTIKLSIPAASLPIKGCFGYAWFVDVETTNAGTLAGAKFAGITTVPYAYVSGTPTGTQLGTAAGLNLDNSYNAGEFTGLLGYAAATPGAYWLDLQGASLTSGKNGRVTEVETVLQYMFANYQCGPDEIWGSADAIECLDAAVRYSGTSGSGFQFVTQRDGQNNILGGFLVSAYQSRFAVASPTGSIAIPIRIHPMIPSGTLYFHLKNNPYPHSRAPYMAGVLVQRDYYSIEWPMVTRSWQFGTYLHEVLALEMPWILGVITGISQFVGN